VEVKAVKHLVRITKDIPASADVVEDILCAFSNGLGALTGFKGGDSPGLNFVNDKCDVTPEGDGETAA